MKNYEELKLLNQYKEMKRLKREEDIRPWQARDSASWGWYTQWSVPTLLVFAVIAVVICIVCYRCMGYMSTQLSNLV